MIKENHKHTQLIGRKSWNHLFLFFVYLLLCVRRCHVNSAGVIGFDPSRRQIWDKLGRLCCGLTAYLMSSALEMTNTMSFPSRVFDPGLTSPLSQGLSGEPGGPLAPAGLSPDWPRAPRRHFSHRRPHLSGSKVFMFRFMSRPQNYTQQFSRNLRLIWNSVVGRPEKDIEESAEVLQNKQKKNHT